MTMRDLFIFYSIKIRELTLIKIVIAKILILLTVTKVVYNLSIGEGDADFSAIWVNLKKWTEQYKTLSPNFKNCHGINHS